jgi:hypothetical protein
MHIMTENGWRLIGGPMKTSVEAPAKWWHYPQADETAYERMFINDSGIDYRTLWVAQGKITHPDNVKRFG